MAVIISALSLGVATLLAAQTPSPGNVAAAARAFSAGQAAELERDFQRAAQSYELANTISPTAGALRSACRARFLAKQLARAAQHAIDLKAKYTNSRIVAFAERILEKTRPKVFRILVRCKPPCTIESEGRALRVDTSRSHTIFVEPGQYNLVAKSADGLEELSVEGRAGMSRTLVFKSPKPIPGLDVPKLGGVAVAEVKEPFRGFDRGFVIGAAAVTAALAGVSTWAIIDANNSGDDLGNPSSGQTLDDTQSRHSLARALVVSTGVALVASVALAAFGTDWGEDDEPSAITVGVDVERSQVLLNGRF